MRGSGLVSIWPNLEKSTAGISGMPDPPEGAATAGAALGPFRKLSTSSLVMRPFSPVPFHLGQIDAKLPRHPAHAGAGVDVAEVGRRSRRGAGPPVGRGRRLGRRRVGVRHRHRLGLRRRLLLGDQGGRLGHGAVSALEHQDRRALADLVADLDQDLLHRAAGWRRHLHGRLVGLQRQQRVLGVDRVAFLDQDLDDRDVLEVADVGHAHLCRACRTGFGHGSHRRFLPRFLLQRPFQTVAGQTVIGLGFSQSIPYFRIASATTLGSTAPSSASDLSAATVTQCRSTSKKWRSLRR